MLSFVLIAHQLELLLPFEKSFDPTGVSHFEGVAALSRFAQSHVRLRVIVERFFGRVVASATVLLANLSQSCKKFVLRYQFIRLQQVDVLPFVVVVQRYVDRNVAGDCVFVGK